ncbi:MAG: glycosyltransferase family 4 protein [Candidatus Levyibacteriota bacterium]
MNKKKIAIVRGKFLNKYEMQSFEPLASRYDLIAFGSKTSYHDKFLFPVVKLSSPLDLPSFPYKIQILNRLFSDAHYLLGLERKLLGFDIAHTAETYFHYTRQCLIAKKKGHVKKVVATVWENIPFNNEGVWGRTALKRNAILQIDHFVAVTNASREALLLEGVDESKISVINPGIDTKIFKPVRKSYVKKDINVLFVGRLEDCKGVFEVIFAAKKLLQDVELKEYKLKFTFVGEGSRKQRLLKLEKRLGIEKFIIHKSVSYGKITKEYDKADIFLAPSKSTSTWKEQYNMALMEAQSCGLPVITTRSGGIEENIGNAGVYVPEADFETLYKEIKNLILTPKRRIGLSLKARKRAVGIHDVRLAARKIDVLYGELLK